MGDTGLFQKILNDNNDRFIVTGISRSSQSSGYLYMNQWDFMYTIGTKTLFDRMQLLHVVSSTPGSFAISEKEYLPSTLRRAIGEKNMNNFFPKTYNLPYETEAFVYALRNNNDVWAMKERLHRGEGVTVLSSRDALEALKADADGKKYIIAQKLVEPQYCPLTNCANVLRVWAVLGGGGGPSGVLRAYLLEGGDLRLSLHETRENNKGESSNEDLSTFVTGLIKDVPLNRTWTLDEVRQDLKKRTGDDTVYQQLWDNIKRTVATSLASSVPAIRYIASTLKQYHSGNLDIIGYDFVIDDNYFPWLIEINPKSGMQPWFQNLTHPFDIEKEMLLIPYFMAMWARWNSMEERIEAATKAVASLGDTLSKDCPIDAELLRQMMDMDLERQAAVEHGLDDITLLVYTALRCIHGDPEACGTTLPRSKECISLERRKASQHGRVGEKKEQRKQLHATTTDDEGYADEERDLRKCSTFSQSEISEAEGRDPRYFVPLPSDSIVWEWLQRSRGPLTAADALQALCSIALRNVSASQQTARDEL